MSRKRLYIKCIKRAILFVSAIAIPIWLIGCSQSTNLADDGFVNVNGGRIAFRVIGEGSRTPVLVIHGGPGASSCTYPSTMMGIAAKRPVITYDQLGNGYSDRIKDLEQYAVLSRFASEVTSIRKELGLEKIHIIGHSWGAAVALEYLLTENPSGVLSTVFIGPFLGTQRWQKDASYLLSQLSEENQTAVRLALATGDFTTDEFGAANKAFWNEYGFRNRSVSYPPDCERSPRGDSGLYKYMWGPSEFIINGTLQDYDRIDRLPELNIPVLFLIGEYDEVRSETMREYQALVPGSVVKVIPDAGHMVNLDQSEAFNAAVIEFFTTVEGK